MLMLCLQLVKDFDELEADEERAKKFKHDFKQRHAQIKAVVAQLEKIAAEIGVSAEPGSSGRAQAVKILDERRLQHQTLKPKTVSAFVTYICKNKSTV